RLSRRVLSALFAGGMFGAIDRFGRRAWTGLRARIRFRRRSIGTSGLDPRQNVLTGRLGPKEMEQTADANAVARAEYIIRLCGAVGRISAPARWAIWLAIRRTCRSARSSLVIRRKSKPKAQASIKKPTP